MAVAEVAIVNDHLCCESAAAKVLTMTDNTAQKVSPSYRLPALDQDFLLGDSMRGVRLQLEYEKAEERLRA